MKGKVYLVGAGPGDKKLITIKGAEKIQEADVIIYDRLANPALLQYCKKGCEQYYVGKEVGNHTTTQDEINELLVQKAMEEKVVVRLKGGDPYVFGRGGEEGEALYKQGIDFEVIPGITSSIGGLAYGGIPITHRDYAPSFHVITGHLKSEKDQLYWEILAKLRGTMVFLMGIGNLQNICSNLVQNGKDPSTPVAIIHKATTSDQRTVVGTLSNIEEIVAKANINPPSLIVIGEVVKCREALNFYERKPLFGKRIIVTRSRAQSSELLEQIYELGGRGIELPTIRIESLENPALERAIQQVSTYTHIVFTSRNSVDCFFKALNERQKDSRTLGNCKIVAVGKGTATQLQSHGIIPNIVPSEYVGEGIVKALKDQLTSEHKILLPGSKNARPYLRQELLKICQVDQVSIYETTKETNQEVSPVQILKEEKIDYITFTSSSTVQNFMEMIGEKQAGLLSRVKIISIGPITSKKVEAYGLNVYREAKEHTLEGMIQEIRKDVEGERIE